MTQNKAKIPFTFVAIPEYFYRSGWIQTHDEKKYFRMTTFLHWAFGKCSSYSKRIAHDGKMIDLGPFEFIFGRSSSSNECGLTEDQLRHQLKLHLDAKFLEKAPSSVPGRFTVYRWATERFSENNPQLSTQLSTQLNPQLSTHKLEDENEKDEKEYSLKKENEQKKEKQPAAVAQPSAAKSSKIVSFPSIEEMNEIIEATEAYISHHELKISTRVLKIWLMKYDKELIFQQLANLADKKNHVAKHEAWMETVLFAVQNCNLNRDYIEAFVKKNNIIGIICLKNYCRDKQTGNDYSYNLPHEQFKSIINRKYDRNIGVL